MKKGFLTIEASVVSVVSIFVILTLFLILNSTTKEIGEYKNLDKEYKKLYYEKITEIREEKIMKEIK